MVDEMETTQPPEGGHVVIEMDEMDTDPLAPYQKEKIIWSTKLAEPLPFLMPDEQNEGKVIEMLPPEKDNRKIRWSDDVHLCEMPNRRQLGLFDEDEEDDDNSYEIEIVEDDGDADFYLEIVDGEIFYVFETEDDSDEEMADEDDSDSGYGDAAPPMQLPIESMMAPSLDDDEQPPIAQFDPTALTAASSGPTEKPHVIEPEQEDMVSETPQSQKEEHRALEKPQTTGEPDNELPQEDVEEPRARYREEQASAFAGASSSPEREKPLLEQSYGEEDGFITPLATPVNSPVKGAKDKVDSGVPPAPLSPVPPSTPNNNLAPRAPASPAKSILKACPPSPHRSPHRNKKESKEKTKKPKVTKTYVRADTFDGEHQVFTWTKPDWVEENKLKKTDRGQDVRKGANLASPITFPKQGKKNATQEQHSKDVYEDEDGNVIEKEELIRKIEAGEQGVMAFVPRPTYGGKYQRKLRFSEKGQQIRSGLGLEKPITKATVDRKRDDINLMAQPKDVLKNKIKVERKIYGWQKPEWARKGPSQPLVSPSKQKKQYKWDTPEWTKPKLRSNGLGDAMKGGGKLEKPITHIAEHLRRSMRSEAEKAEQAGSSDNGAVQEEKNLEEKSEEIIVTELDDDDDD